MQTVQTESIVSGSDAKAVYRAANETTERLRCRQHCTSGSGAQPHERRTQHAALAADGGRQQPPKLGGARLERARQAGSAGCVVHVRVRCWNLVCGSATNMIIGCQGEKGGPATCVGARNDETAHEMHRHIRLLNRYMLTNAPASASASAGAHPWQVGAGAACRAAWRGPGRATRRGTGRPAAWPWQTRPPDPAVVHHFRLCTTQSRCEPARTFCCFVPSSSETLNAASGSNESIASYVCAVLPLAAQVYRVHLRPNSPHSVHAPIALFCQQATGYPVAHRTKQGA